jgi:GT2 family glycosyltransferase
MASQDKQFSIIVPTFRRPAQLSECLDSMTALLYPADEFEVIVVDDDSEPRPRDVVSSYKEKIDVRLIEQQHSGPAAARNRGAQEARGAYLAFTDDDCKPSPDWLQKIEKIFEAHPKCVIAGRAVNLLQENLYSEASQIVCDYLHSYYNRDKATFLTSNNMAVTGELFTEIGGFDTSFPLAAGEDREFCDRAVHLGYETLYSNDVIVHHAHRLTFRKFMTQHYNYGKGAHRYHSLRNVRYGEEFKLEPLSFYTDLMAYPWKTSTKRKLYIASLLFVSQIANAAGFFMEKLKRTTA